MNTQPSYRRNDLLCCPKCRAMTGTREGLYALRSEEGYLHSSWGGIQDAAGQGCPLCKIVVSTFLRDESHEIRFSLEHHDPGLFSKSSVPSQNEEHDQLYNLRVTNIAEWGSDTGLFECVASEDNAASALAPLRPVLTSLSAQAAAHIQQYLYECQNEHPNCPRGRTPELPRRVIEVCTQPNTARLYQPAELESAQYATLSYCWGPAAQHLTTTTSNLRNHMHALPSTLPNTILDAIDVCRKIGINYLWVDALCIIQDNDEDKNEQIDKMGSIYQNSLLTIVAASGTKVSDGFLFDGKPSEIFAELPLWLEESKLGTIWLRNTRYIQEHAEDPVYRRAWTLQEHVLSPRRITFGSSEPRFKCIGAVSKPVLVHRSVDILDESQLPLEVFGLKHENAKLFLNALSNVLSYRESALSMREKFEAIYSQMAKLAFHRTYPSIVSHQLWSSLLLDYSRRNITYASDRLPALAGIARLLSEVWEDEYIAGIWRKSIVMDLCWHYPSSDMEERNRKDDERSRCLDSPSWSWISVTFPLEFQSVVKADATLVGHSVHLVSPSVPFGEVKDASITLKAHVILVRDLDATFSVGPPNIGDDQIAITLDFETNDPASKNYKLIYLGRGEFDISCFLVVEPRADSTYCRAGFTIMTDVHQKFLRSLMRFKRREIIVIT